MAGEKKKNVRRSLGSAILPRAWHERLQFERYPIHAFVRSRVYPLLADGVRVLDAGAGRIEEQYLRDEIIATGARLETLDMLPGEGVDHVGDAAAMDFPEETFDVVLCTQVLEHVTDPRAVCEELFRVLKGGGYAAITAPQSAFLHNLPYHYFHFTNIGLKMLLEESGFEVLECEPQGGHFVNLAVQLHYTAMVVGSFATTPFSKVLLFPVILLLRLCCGLIAKTAALVLEKLFPFEGNTQGWCVLCRKPGAGAAVVERSAEGGES